MLDDRGNVASKQRTRFSHRSTPSPCAYRIGSESVISRNDRDDDELYAPSEFLKVLRSATFSSPLIFGATLDCSRNC